MLKFLYVWMLMDFTCCAAAVAAMIERLIQIDKASLQFLKSPKKQWIQSSIASIQRNQGCHRSWPISRLSAQNRFSPDERNTKNGLSANPSLVFMHQSSTIWNKTNWMTNSSWYLECESHCVIWIHRRKVILGILGKCGRVEVWKLS